MPNPYDEEKIPDEDLRKLIKQLKRSNSRLLEELVDWKKWAEQSRQAEEIKSAADLPGKQGNIFVRLCRAISIISGGFLLGSGFSHGSILFSILGTVVGFAAFAFNEAMIRREA